MIESNKSAKKFKIFHSYSDQGNQAIPQRKSLQKFMEAFEMNLEAFEGKVVLNVGCGHGLLSMLAAKVCKG